MNSAELVEKLVAALVAPWEPEWAVVCSSAVSTTRQTDGPFLHKALYLQSGMAFSPDLPSDTVMRDLGRGRLFLPVQAP
ncbi:hypothetical protein QTH89_26470 [Variovorax sp. J22G21]|uniref:hypothetical protein n=1 Tax=Variovorax fucosicus TaxID=3053517 RepID=UPI0025753BEF|nr:hypothetical protein [Variovorax sp. J22G21]MDM0064788.1 hypothetical protein [Variovorax sp. J22G21]